MSRTRQREQNAYSDVLLFLEEAAATELAAFVKSISKEDMDILQIFSKGVEAEEEAEAEGKGAAVDARQFFLALKRATKGGTRTEVDALRSDMISIFKRIAGPKGKGSVFTGALWDLLPEGWRKEKGGRSLSREKVRGGGGASRQRSRTSKRKNIPVRGFAVVHSTEKPWVNEPNYQRWLKKLRRHTAKVRRDGDDDNPQNLCVDSKICKGDLGIPRRLMPQFTSPKDIASFTRFAEKRYGIGSHRTTRRAARLRPSQEEINRERVEDVKEEIIEKKLDPNVPLIISRDRYVIDGHHRWAAYKTHRPMKRLPVLLVEAPARDVLSVAATWGAKHHQF